MDTILNTDIIASILKLKDLIELAVLIIGVPFILYQIILLTKQFKLSIKQSKEQTNWNKMNVTFDYISRYTVELKDMNKKILHDFGVLGQNENAVSEDRLKKLLKDSSLRADIMRLLSYFDNLALGIRNDYFNNDIAEDSLIVMAIKTYEAITPYIEMRREKLGIKIASNYEKLYLEWKQTINTKY